MAAQCPRNAEPTHATDTGYGLEQTAIHFLAPAALAAVVGADDRAATAGPPGVHGARVHTHVVVVELRRAGSGPAVSKQRPKDGDRGRHDRDCALGGSQDDQLRGGVG